MVVSAIPLSRQAVLSALYWDTALLRPPYCDTPTAPDLRYNVLNASRPSIPWHPLFFSSFCYFHQRRGLKIARSSQAAARPGSSNSSRWAAARPSHVSNFSAGRITSFRSARPAPSAPMTSIGSAQHRCNPVCVWRCYSWLRVRLLLSVLSQKLAFGPGGQP